MRRLVLLAATLLAGSTASAQRSGLLLGFSTDSGYRTLWIAPVNGKVSVAAAQPMLIVPRPDGFHHLGVVKRCSLQETGEIPESGPYVNEEDILVDLRLGAPATEVDSAMQSCDLAWKSVGAQHDSVARADSIALSRARTAQDSAMFQGGSDDEGSAVCNFDALSITYVSSRYLSTYEGYGSTEFCNPGRYTSSYRRRTFHRDTGDVALLPLLPAAAAKRLVARWEKEKGECALEDSPDASWGVVRALGEWQAAFETSGATACRGESGQSEQGFSIVQRVPPPVAQREPAERWMPALRKAYPKLDDVFVSPAGDLVVARVGQRLSAHHPLKGALGEPVLEVDLHPGATVVMAEWATGAHVDRWTRELSAVKERW